MIKKKIPGKNIKELLMAKATDRFYRFMLADGTVRGGIVNGTLMINEMRTNHELGILETLVLGHSYLGAGLMSAGLKGNDRINMQIECSGPIKGLSVESNAHGEIRGYLYNVPIPVHTPVEDFNLSPFFGAGFLTVTKYLENAKQPFTGRTILQYGNIAQDMANYFLVSEQIPTAFSLSIKFDINGNVTGAGGLFLQAMPDADEKIISLLETEVKNMPSLGKAFSAGENSEKFINTCFDKFSPNILQNYRIEFFCHCNKEKTFEILKTLPEKEVRDILENGPFPVHIKCHNCNSLYQYEKPDIEKLLGNIL